MAETKIRNAVKSTLSFFKVGIYRTPYRTQVWSNPSSTIKHQRIVSLATYAPWLTDGRFSEISQYTAGNTLVDNYRCYELWTLGQQTSKIEGDILEVGVWRGGTGVVLAESVRHDSSKIVYLADTFTGVVKAGSNDQHYSDGEHSDTSEKLVKDLLSQRSLSNYETLVGIFPDDTGDRIRGKLSLVHCDVDVYQSAKDVIMWCLPRLSIGSVLVFDDYGFSTCEGITKLCNEWAARDDFMFIHNLNGHAVFVKIK